MTAAWSASAINTPSAVCGVCARPSRIELAMPSAQSRFTATEAGLCLSSGASSPAFAPSTTVTECPASSTARLTTVCISGRPLTRTSCLAEPKRVERRRPAPPRGCGSPRCSAVVTFGVEESDREHGDHADTGDQRSLAGHLGEGRTWNDFEHHENGDGRQRQNVRLASTRARPLWARISESSFAVRGSWRRYYAGWPRATWRRNR